MNHEKKNGKPVDPMHMETIEKNLPQLTKFCDMKPYHGDKSYQSLFQYMKEAEVVISHAGVNSIISCMKLHKPLLITPRRASFGEHVDNHQVEIASLMADKFEVTVDYDLDNLQQTLEIAKRKEYKPWVSDKNELITALRNDIINFL